MGGLRVLFAAKKSTPGGLEFGNPINMSTDVPGLYAMGEASFAYHGDQSPGRE